MIIVAKFNVHYRADYGQANYQMKKQLNVDSNLAVGALKELVRDTYTPEVVRGVPSARIRDVEIRII